MITGTLLAVQISLWLAIALTGEAAVWNPLLLMPGQFSPIALLTAPFIHLGVLHLTTNMALLWLLGRPLERSLGSPAYFLLYLGSALAGGLMHLSIAVLLPGQAGGPAFGASGAVAGLMGAYAIRFSYQRVPLPILGGPRLSVPTALLIWAAAEVVQGAAAMLREQGAAVGHWAHVGGFVFGLSLAQWMGAGRAAEAERLLREVASGRRHPEEARGPLHDLLNRGCTEGEIESLLAVAPRSSRPLFESWIEAAATRGEAEGALPVEQARRLYHAAGRQWGELHLSSRAREVMDGEP
jgi:membrane associated rhomboid family serine protease